MCCFLFSFGPLVFIMAQFKNLNLHQLTYTYFDLKSSDCALTIEIIDFLVTNFIKCLSRQKITSLFVISIRERKNRRSGGSRLTKKYHLPQVKSLNKLIDSFFTVIIITTNHPTSISKDRLVLLITVSLCK